MKNEKRKKNKKTANTRYVKLGSITVVLVLAVSVFSAAWFTFSRYGLISSLSMKSIEEKFELASCTDQSLYDKLLVNVNDTDKRDDDTPAMQTGIAQDYSGTTLYRTDSENDLNTISWMLTDTSNLGNVEDHDNGVGPGEGGTISFYVIPKTDGDFTVNFDIDFTMYSDRAPESDQAVYIYNDYCYPVQKPSELYDIIKGHLLFFDSVTENGQYSGRLFDYDTHTIKFSRTFENAEKDVPQKVDIHWVWPYVVGMTVLPDGHKNLGNYRSIFAVNSMDDENGDKSLFLSDLTENTEYYLAAVGNYEELQTVIDNNTFYDTVSEMANGNSLNLFPELSAAWNKADQKLGIESDCIKVTLTARSE